MRVREVMTPSPTTILSTENLRTAIDKMDTQGCRRLPVVDDKGHLVGIITDRDVRLAMNSPLVMRERWQDELLLDHTEVDACMTDNPVIVEPDAPLQIAIDLMVNARISGLPVMEADRLVGIITVTDLMKALQRLLDDQGE